MSPLTEPYIAFMVFGSQDFEKFLQVFQYDQPMIPNEQIRFQGTIVTELQRAAKKPEEILDIDVCKKSNCKKPHRFWYMCKNGVCWCSSDRQQENETWERMLTILPSVCAVFT